MENFKFQGAFILETKGKKHKNNNSKPESLVKHFYTVHFISAAAFELQSPVLITECSDPLFPQLSHGVTNALEPQHYSAMQVLLSGALIGSYCSGFYSVPLNLLEHCGKCQDHWWGGGSVRLSNRWMEGLGSVSHSSFHWGSSAFTHPKYCDSA